MSPTYLANVCNIAQPGFRPADNLVVSPLGKYGKKPLTKEAIAGRRSKMKILIPALVVSVGLLSLLYRALCSWAQNDMRNAMYGEGRVPGNTPVSHSNPTSLPPPTLQDNDNPRALD